MKIQFAGCLKNKKRKIADKLHIQTKDERERTTMIAVIDYDAGNLKSVEKGRSFLRNTSHHQRQKKNF